MNNDQKTAKQRTDVAVWDPLVRLGHWAAVAAFAVAYLTEGEPRWAHTLAGYTLAAYVAVRLVWGFVGPESARFKSFVRSPLHAARYLLDLIRGRSQRYVGHSPAGGVMIVLLILTVTGTTAAGLMLYALHDSAGPLAALVASDAIPAPDAEDPRVDFWEETHEVLANLTLLLVILHIAGVVTASIAHRENLVKAMITGRKRANDPVRSPTTAEHAPQEPSTYA